MPFKKGKKGGNRDLNEDAKAESDADPKPTKPENDSKSMGDKISSLL